MKRFLEIRGDMEVMVASLYPPYSFIPTLVPAPQGWGFFLSSSKIPHGQDVGLRRYQNEKLLL